VRERCLRAERDRDDNDNKREILCEEVREEERRFRMRKAERGVFLKSEVWGLCLC